MAKEKGPLTTRKTDIAAAISAMNTATGEMHNGTLAYIYIDGMRKLKRHANTDSSTA